MNIDFEAIANGIVEKLDDMFHRDSDPNPNNETTHEQKVAVVLKHLRPIRQQLEKAS